MFLVLNQDADTIRWMTVYIRRSMKRKYGRKPYPRSERLRKMVSLEDKLNRQLSLF